METLKNYSRRLQFVDFVALRFISDFNCEGVFVFLERIDLDFWPARESDIFQEVMD